MFGGAGSVVIRKSSSVQVEDAAPRRSGPLQRSVPRRRVSWRRPPPVDPVRRRRPAPSRRTPAACRPAADDHDAPPEAVAASFDSRDDGGAGRAQLAQGGPPDAGGRVVPSRCAGIRRPHAAAGASPGASPVASLRHAVAPPVAVQEARAEQEVGSRNRGAHAWSRPPRRRVTTVWSHRQCRQARMLPVTDRRRIGFRPAMIGDARRRGPIGFGGEQSPHAGRIAQRRDFPGTPPRVGGARLPRRSTLATTGVSSLGRTRPSRATRERTPGNRLEPRSRGGGLTLRAPAVVRLASDAAPAPWAGSTDPWWPGGTPECE